MENLFPYTIQNCNNCKGENKLYLMDLARSFVCVKCKRPHYRKGLEGWRDIDPLPKLLGKFYIPLHGKARIDGHEYTVTARFCGKDMEGYTWREYWAYHPLKGYVYFSEYNGHWVKVTDVDRAYDLGPMELYENGLSYKKFSSFKFKYIAMEGELPFEPDFKTYSSRCEEYISPPYFIAVEKSEDGIGYTLGEHITSDEIRKIFGLTSEGLPGKAGVGMVETYRGYIPVDISDAKVLSLVGGLLILLITIIYGLMLPNETVYETLVNENATAPVVSEVVEIKSSTQNLQFEIASPLSNNWAGVSIDVVNIESGDIITVYGETEFYSGYEGGEHWSEGSMNTHFMISSVPPGKYRFEITPYGGTGYGYISLTIKRGVFIFRNMLIAIGIIILFPLLLVWLNRSFEVSRWSNSNYSPYDE